MPDFWTIPVEIRGSMKVYLTLLGLSNVRKTVRILIIGLLCVRSWWNGTPEFMAFFAGVLYAELSACVSFGQQEILSPLLSSRRHNRRLSPSKTVLNRLSSLSTYSVFLLGIYLLCLPIRIQSDGTIDANFPPDWFFLEWCPPLLWWNTETTMRTWHTFGAILVVGSMRALPRLRAPFETRAAQFLDCSSYHATLVFTLDERVRYWRELLRSSCTRKVGDGISGVDVNNTSHSRSTTADKCLYGRIGGPKKYRCGLPHGETIM
ncbi:hypothetical protein IG631_19028 [Alternaria alternata]|nr:hypothetical protein IG631_19028 [Alternaria alternata]